MKNSKCYVTANDMNRISKAFMRAQDKLVDRQMTLIGALIDGHGCPSDVAFDLTELAKKQSTPLTLDDIEKFMAERGFARKYDLTGNPYK